MGEVYRARDTRLGRDVAIKVLPESFAADADRRARFEREAQAVAALSHPNVVAIFDSGLYDGTGAGHAQLYVVMELLEGQTLRDRLAGGPLPVRKAVEIGVQIAQGLGAAHARQLVHRDLKPENIFLLEDGRVKVLDFGLARQTPAAEASGATATAALTDVGMVLGTVGYMAPEQVRGQVVDARADIFAFGAVLYEMVSGRRAFQRDTAADSLSAILTDDPPELTGSRPDLSPALDRIIRHCLEKNPQERFQNVRDIAFALEALSGTAVSSSAVAAVAAASSRSLAARLTPWLVGVAVVGAAGYVASGGLTRQSADAAGVTYQPVSFESGFVFAARFGIDGRSVVYSADWDQQPRGVFVTSLDTREYRPLGFEGSDLLALSRAGDLALLTDPRVTAGNPYTRRGTIVRASAAGGMGRPELDGVKFADFGPSDTMAIVRNDGRRETIEYPVGQVLDEVPGRLSAFMTPRVSPSGDHVAYFATENGGLRVRIHDRAGTKVAESRPFADWWSLAWAPSGEVWFAAVEGFGRQTAIFALDTSGQERTIYRAPGAITLHDISPTGEVLVSFDRGTRRIELVEGDRAPLERSWRDEAMPVAISDAGALLLNLIGDSGGPNGSVHFWPPGQPAPIRLSDGLGVALSPDGSQALVATGDAAKMQLAIVPTGVGLRRELDLGGDVGVGGAHWLPDGSLLLLVGGPDGQSRVVRAPAEGGAPVDILDRALVADAIGAEVSPDGRRIVVHGVGGALLLCDVTSGDCRPGPTLEDGLQVSAWSADGAALLVYSERPGPLVLERLDPTTGRRTPWRTLTPLQPAVSGVRPLLVSRTGLVAYAYRRADAQLYIIRGLR